MAVIRGTTIADGWDFDVLKELSEKLNALSIVALKGLYILALLACGALFGTGIFILYFVAVHQAG